MTKAKEETFSEKIGTLTANVNNLNKRIDELVEVSHSIYEYFGVTKNNNERLCHIEGILENFSTQIENVTVSIAEKFGMIYSDRENIYKDLVFLRGLRLSAEETKKEIFKNIFRKLFEWGAIAYVAAQSAPYLTGN